MTTLHDSILSPAERARRVALLAELTSVGVAALRHADDVHLDILAEGTLTRWGYRWCPARGWRVHVRFLPLWGALRAHARRLRAIETRLVAEHEWHERRVAA